MKQLPLAIRTPPDWKGLSSPLDLDKVEADVSEFYVAPLRRLVKALCDEIKNLRAIEKSGISPSS